MVGLWAERRLESSTDSFGNPTRARAVLCDRRLASVERGALLVYKTDHSWFRVIEPEGCIQRKTNSE
eukprot:279559-Rhodomonas_salina.1